MAVVQVMGAFRSVALGVLEKNGIVDPQPDGWYPLDSWLSSFETIAKDIGPNTLHQIGRYVSSTGPMPPHIGDLHEALALLDDAYHSQHRGGDIGHFHYIATGDRSGTMITTTPYPSEFDRGVLAALVERVEVGSLVSIERDRDAESRQDGGASCTYLINW